MASGQQHDLATLLCCFPFGIGLSLLTDWRCGLIGALSFALGGLWLSPDLDTQSRALQRWGFLKWIWWPYRKVIPHRSIFSHGPIIGTIVKLIYLFIYFWFLLILLDFFDLIEFLQAFDQLSTNLKFQSRYLLFCLIGIEASLWLHLVQDGDPIPIEWKRWFRR